MAKCGCKHQDHDYYYERQRRRRHLALFLIALLVIILIIAIVYVTAFKPRDTEVSIVSVQVSTPPTILTGGPTTTTATSTSTTTNTQLSYVNASLFYQVHIYNPNRATYHVFGSDAILYFYASGVGTLPIPGFDIAPRNSIDISFVLTGDFTPAATGVPYLLGDVSSGILPLTSIVTVRGRVTTLNAFSHSGSSRAACSISLSLQSKSIQTYVCK